MVKTWMSVKLLRLIKKKCAKHPKDTTLNYVITDQLKLLIPVTRDNYYIDEFRKTSGNIGDKLNIVNKILNRKQINHDMISHIR